MKDEHLRRQVIRRVRYGMNVVALERDIVPPESPFDVALTNGLAAIVAHDHPGTEWEPDGRMKPASKLLTILENADTHYDLVVLRRGLADSQPLRHGRADDEHIMAIGHYLGALTDLDDHTALSVLGQARAAATLGELTAQLYVEAAEEATGLATTSHKERLLQPELEMCDNCSRTTFLPSGYDEFGGTNSPGECVACGYVRDRDTAHHDALDAEWQRWDIKD